MNSAQQEILDLYANEVAEMVSGMEVGADKDHLWSNYQEVTAVIMRLGEIHNEISLMEIRGEDWPELKKFRTLIVDPTVERMEKVAAFESRKITAMQVEKDLDR